MEITLTELKGNLGKYITMSQREDILITKNGRIISRLTEPFSARKDKMKKQQIAKRLVGSIDGEYISLEEIRLERLKRHESSHRH